MREPELYRYHLERLDKMFPENELLTPTMVGKVQGICRQTASKRYPFEGKFINKVALAWAMAKEGT